MTNEEFDDLCNEYRSIIRKPVISDFNKNRINEIINITEDYINTIETNKKNEILKIDEVLNGQDKPTLQQVAWVFSHIKNSAPCSFRYLIYESMKLDKSAYCLLFECGGQDISNAMFDYK